jgi:hypothetical protein
MRKQLKYRLIVYTFLLSFLMVKGFSFFHFHNETENHCTSHSKKNPHFHSNLLEKCFFCDIDFSNKSFLQRIEQYTFNKLLKNLSFSSEKFLRIRREYLINVRGPPFYKEIKMSPVSWG